MMPPRILSVLMPTRWIASAREFGLPERASLPMNKM
jgi:hypothetical protein